MIEVLSSWAKGLGLAIVIVSILEMLLPNNKTKKYIRMIMGLYVLFTLIEPFVTNKEMFDINNLDINDYIQTQATSSEINQDSMNDRIEKLYIQELEKDITEKLNQKKFNVTKCKVEAKISDKEEPKITKIKLNIENVEKNENKTEKIENKIVTEVQKIKPVEKENNVLTEKENESNSKREKEKITRTDIENIKKFLIEEYEVKQKCLEIN